MSGHDNDDGDGDAGVTVSGAAAQCRRPGGAPADDAAAEAGAPADLLHQMSSERRRLHRYVNLCRHRSHRVGQWVLLPLWGVLVTCLTVRVRSARVWRCPRRPCFI